MRLPVIRTRWWIVLGLVGVAIPFVGAGAIQYTSTDEFCTSCHSMGVVTAEYRESRHFLNTAGVRAGCADCHVPDPIGPLLVAKIIAVKDVYHELAGTIEAPELFERHRWRLANTVWDKMLATDSRECRSCHSFDAMQEAEQDRITTRRHERAQRGSVTCIACHKGVAHREPDPPLDLSSNPSSIADLDQGAPRT